MSTQMSKFKRYSDKPFFVALVMMFSFEAILLMYLTSYGDYTAHAEFSKWLFEHEISFGEIQYKAVCAYPLYHVLLKLLYLFSRLDYEICATFLMTLCNLTTVLMVRELLKIIVRTGTDSYYIDFISLFSIVFMSARGPWTDWHYYIIVEGPNPLHNPSFIMVRPFMLCTIFCFCELYKKFTTDKKLDVCFLIGYGVSAFLAALAKPSFAVIYYPIMALCTLYLMIKERKIAWGGQILLGTLPSVVLLFVQRWWILANSQRLDVVIRFGSYVHLAPVKVLIYSIATLPAVILLFDFHRLKKDIYYLISIGGLVSGWLQLYFLDEGPDGNFAWGYSLAVMFATVTSLANPRHIKAHRKSVKFVLALVVFGYQALVGVLYLYMLYKHGEIGI